MKSNSIAQIWEDFCNVYPEHTDKVYDAWAFGDSKETADGFLREIPLLL